MRQGNPVYLEHPTRGEFIVGLMVLVLLVVIAAVVVGRSFFFDRESYRSRPAAPAARPGGGDGLPKVPS